MTIQVVLTMYRENVGTWRVSAPNGHYRESSTARLAETVSKVVADYGVWLQEVTSLDHLDITIKDRRQ